MNPSSAIIDTSVLIYLYRLDLLDKLHMFYNEVLVPRKVEFEFLNKIDQSEKNKRLDYLERLYTNSSWLKRCQEYDDNTVFFYLQISKMNEGESEVFAQCQVLGKVHKVLIDEKIARQVAEQYFFDKRGFLSLLAQMDIVYNFCHYFESVEKLKKESNARFSETIINKAWTEIKNKK